MLVHKEFPANPGGRTQFFSARFARRIHTTFTVKQHCFFVFPLDGGEKGVVLGGGGGGGGGMDLGLKTSSL